MQIRVETTKIIPDCDSREVKMQLCGSRLGRVPCQSKLQRKNAGTSSWPSWISHFTGSFVGHSPSEMLCPPALFRKGEDGRKKKREVLHLFRCYTHTHRKVWQMCAQIHHSHLNSFKTCKILSSWIGPVLLMMNVEELGTNSPRHSSLSVTGNRQKHRIAFTFTPMAAPCVTAWLFRTCSCLAHLHFTEQVPCLPNVFHAGTVVKLLSVPAHCPPRLAIPRRAENTKAGRIGPTPG